MILLTDTHCHLDFDQFDHDRDSVLERAWLAGIQRIMIPAVHIDTIKTALILANENEKIFTAVGVHPNSANVLNTKSMVELHRLASNPRVIAIGEIGLDYYRDFTPVEIQQQILNEQLAMAAELDKPVILHCRNAFDDLIKILMEWYEQLPTYALHLRQHPGVLHSFSGTVQQVKTAVQMGFMIGINGSITFQNNDKFKEVIQSIDKEFLLLETDAPFITPVPYRGKRNEPAFVSLVNDSLSTALNITTEECAKITYNNACRIFHW